MRIAFYAPLKAPDHPVPSGDRAMAQLLMAALTRAGHKVSLVSALRGFLSDASTFTLQLLLRQSEEEMQRLETKWKREAPPDIWFTYHPYYKAPDLIGLNLARRFSMPYVTCEASYSPKRDRDVWRQQQALIKESLAGSALNIYFTERDRSGLAQIVSSTTLAELKPFTDMAERLPAQPSRSAPSTNLITIAMMRKGDKFDSFCMLAAALELLGDFGWHLSVIGDGPLAKEVKDLFCRIPADRLTWMGELPPSEIPNQLAKASIYVWPGCGEAYGMGYLEAQAAGLPVIAQRTAGVPSVVLDGETGLLTKEGDVRGFASAIREWIVDPVERGRFGMRAWDFIRRERSLDQAATKLSALLSGVLAESSAGVR
jgi:glycosyltransferase involved in cell wall biosynthesis